MSWSGWYLRNSSISAILRSVIGVVTPFRWLVVLLLEGNAPVTFSVNHRPDSTGFYTLPGTLTRFVPGAFRQSGTLVCLRAAITVCADTCHASSGPHRPLLRYDCSTASSTSRALTPSLTRWWGVTPMTASARYAYCLPARWRKYVRS